MSILKIQFLSCSLDIKYSYRDSCRKAFTELRLSIQPCHYKLEVDLNCKSKCTLDVHCYKPRIKWDWTIQKSFRTVAVTIWCQKDQFAEITFKSIIFLLVKAAFGIFWYIMEYMDGGLIKQCVECEWRESQKII